MIIATIQSKEWPGNTWQVNDEGCLFYNGMFVCVVPNWYARHAFITPSGFWSPERARLMVWYLTHAEEKVLEVAAW